MNKARSYEHIIGIRMNIGIADLGEQETTT